MRSEIFQKLHAACEIVDGSVVKDMKGDSSILCRCGTAEQVATVDSSKIFGFVETGVELHGAEAVISNVLDCFAAPSIHELEIIVEVSDDGVVLRAKPLSVVSKQRGGQ